MSLQLPETENIYKLEATCPISISETECTHKIKPVVLFNYMQDLAKKSLEKSHSEYSCEELLKQGLGWVIIRYRIEFENYENDIKEVKVLTENRGCQKLTAYRDFEILDNITQKRILKAFSSWFVIDLDNKSVVNIEKELPNFRKFTPNQKDLKFNKLKSCENFDSEKFFEVRFDDLDINNHVNNTVYISWALEALNYDFRVANNIKNIDIYFKHEAKYGDKIKSQLKYNSENNTTEHVIKNAQTGEEFCLLRIEFTKL